VGVWVLAFDVVDGGVAWERVKVKWHFDINGKKMKKKINK